jgi:hypothetical protein
VVSSCSIQQSLKELHFWCFQYFSVAFRCPHVSRIQQTNFGFVVVRASHSLLFTLFWKCSSCYYLLLFKDINLLKPTGCVHQQV